MILFINTYKGIGGAENLIFNIIKYASTQNNQLGLISLKDSYLYNRLINENINFKFINYEDKLNKNLFTQNDKLFLFNNWYGIEKLNNFPGKVIIWSVLYSNIINWNRFMFEKKIFNTNYLSSFFNKKLINTLDKENSIYYMDGGVYNEVNKITNNKLNFNILPIPVFQNKLKKMNKNEIKDNIKLTYIGRGDDIWKIKPLKKIANDLKKTNIKIEIHIFTDNGVKYKEELLDIQFPVFFYYNKFGDELEKILFDISDIHVSMGTSALDGAKMGIPTILIDASYEDFPHDYKYKWLFETKDYCLGGFISKENYLSTGHNINEIIIQLKDNNTYNEISNKCYNYVYEMHSINVIYQKLVSINSGISVKKILNLTPASKI